MSKQTFIPSLDTVSGVVNLSDDAAALSSGGMNINAIAKQTQRVARQTAMEQLKTQQETMKAGAEANKAKKWKSVADKIKA